MASPWTYVYIAAGVLVLIAVFWAVQDALGHAGEGCTSPGCLWILAFIFFPPSILFYIFMRLRLSRRVPLRVAEEFERERRDEFFPHLPSDIDKLHLLKHADKEHGTMFDPLASASRVSQGFPHFADSRAEALLEQYRHADALDYLLEMYSVALEDHDLRASDTYRHYCSRIPGGLDALRDWEQDRADAGPGYYQRLQDENDVPF